ncbi:TPA: hypothetical protein ACPJ1I_003933 [Vibrio diabolicus]
MTKTTIALAILTSITSVAQAKSVDREEANRQTNLAIKEQLFAIDAAVTSQLEAQNSTLATIGSTTYEKQENGTWKIVGSTSLAVIAGVLSTSSSTSTTGHPEITNPIEEIPVSPIEATPEADNGRSVEKIADNAWVVKTHDQVDGYLTLENDTIYLRDSERNEIKQWTPSRPDVDRVQLKQKIDQISVKQKQQIKQAIKSRI